MTADRREGGGEGLLYIPDDDLVRRTVDGDDADWSDAQSYTPSDALISSVLRASRRETPRFRFPNWYVSPAPPTVIGRLRTASAIFAALELSPAILAAATILHAVALVALGPLIIGGGRASNVRVATPSVQPPRLIYLAPRAPEPLPHTTRPRARAAMTGSALRLAKPDSTTSVRTPAIDSLSAGADSGARVVATSPEDRELAAALDQEFQLGGDPLRVEESDRERLGDLARVMAARPFARLRVIGAGPPGPDATAGARRGMREAEAFARELIALGVSMERISLDTAINQQGCRASEPRCAANRSRVRTSIAPFSGRRRP
jgi:hypothetical protein